MKSITYLNKKYPDYFIDTNGAIFKKDEDEYIEIKSRDDQRGYLQVDIKDREGNRKTVKVHLALMHTYKPLKNYSGMIVNHKDGNKHNNNIDNLEWLTYRGNTEHAMKNGLRKNTTYLSEDAVKRVAKMLNDGMSISDINAETDIPKHVISDIRRKKSYSFFTKKYNFK